MKRFLAIAAVCLFSVLALAAPNNNNSVARDVWAKSLSGVAATGAGDGFRLTEGGFYKAYTNIAWKTSFTGAPTSITVNLEGSNDGGATWATVDTSTSTSGESRSVTGKFYDYLRCNVAAYVVNGSTATCEIKGVSAGAFVPSNLPVDASTFSGADMCAKVNTALSAYTGTTCGTVTIPRGSFSCSTTIDPGTHLNCTVRGQGKETTVLTYTGTGSLFSETASVGFDIEYLSIVGNPNGLADLVTFRGGEHHAIRHVNITNGPKSANSKYAEDGDFKAGTYFKAISGVGPINTNDLVGLEISDVAITSSGDCFGVGGIGGTNRINIRNSRCTVNLGRCLDMAGSQSNQHNNFLFEDVTCQGNSDSDAYVNNVLEGRISLNNFESANANGAILVGNVITNQNLTIEKNSLHSTGTCIRMPGSVTNVEITFGQNYFFCPYTVQIQACVGCVLHEAAASTLDFGFMNGSSIEARIRSRKFFYSDAYALYSGFGTRTPGSEVAVPNAGSITVEQVAAQPTSFVTQSTTGGTFKCGTGYTARLKGVDAGGLKSAFGPKYDNTFSGSVGTNTCWGTVYWSAAAMPWATNIEVWCGLKQTLGGDSQKLFLCGTAATSAGHLDLHDPGTTGDFMADTTLFVTKVSKDGISASALSGTGSAVACIDATGKITRSANGTTCP